MNTLRAFSIALLIAALTMVPSTDSSADVTNFARRIGEATFNRHHEVGDSTAATMPYHAWASTFYTSLHSFDAGLLSLTRHSDAGQIVLGLDRRRDNWVTGISLSYTQAEGTAESTFQLATVAGSVTSASSTSTSSTQQPGIAGYLAYRFNDTLFANAIVGFEHQRTDFRFNVNSLLNSINNFVVPDLLFEVPFSDLSLNLAKHWGAWFVRGRIGHRFEYAICGSAFCDDRYDNTIYGIGEIGYQTGRWQPFMRTRIEERIFNVGTDLQTYYAGVGAYYRFSNAVDLSLVYERELKEEFFESNQALLNVAFRF